MEQLSVSGLPFTVVGGTNSSYSRVISTEDGSFFFLKTGATEAQFNGLYRIKRTGNTYALAETLYTQNSTITHDILSTVEQLADKRGYINGHPAVLISRNMTTYKELYLISLQGEGSLIRMFTVNAANFSTYKFCINSAKNTVVWTTGSSSAQITEASLDGTTVVTPTAVTNPSLGIFHAGEGVIAFVNPTSIIYRTPVSMTGASTYSATLPNGTSTDFYSFLEFNSIVYRVYSSSGTYSFYLGTSTANPLTRSYNVVAPTSQTTFNLPSTKITHVYSEGLPNLTLLNFRFIQGAYNLVAETLGSFPDYSFYNLCYLPGDFDPNSGTCSAAFYNGKVYVPFVNNSTLQVRSFDLGNTQARDSQNASFITLVPGDPVSIATDGIYDFQVRNPSEKELFFHSTYPISEVPDSTVAPYKSLRLKFTDDSLQRLDATASVKTYGNATFNAEVPRRFVTGVAPAEYVTTNVQHTIGSNDTISVLSTKGKPIKVVRAGTGLLSAPTYSCIISIPGNGLPDTFQIDDIYYWKFFVQCPFSNNLYLFYFASAIMHVTYIDMSSRSVLWTYRTGGLSYNPQLIVPTAAGQFKMLINSTPGATVDCNTRTVSAFISDPANKTEYYKHIHSDALTGSFGTAYGLFFASISEGQSRLILRNWDMAGWPGDELAFVTRGDYVSDALSIRYDFGEPWYYLRSYKLLRANTSTPSITVKTTSVDIQNAILPVSLHNGQIPNRKGIFHYSDRTAFLVESWPNKLKITPFTIHTPDDLDYSGLPPSPTLPSVALILSRINGWLGGG